MSRRTETAYKAQSAGKLAQHNKAPGSVDRVNAAVVQRQFTHLIRGDLSDKRSLYLAAPRMATCRVIGQESAEVIVGEGRYHKVVW